MTANCNSDELAALLEAMADNMGANPTRSGSPVIGTAIGGGTGISSEVHSSQSGGTTIGIAGSVSIGSREENETVALLRDVADKLRSGNADKTMVSRALDFAHRFGAHAVNRASLVSAERLVTMIFGGG